MENFNTLEEDEKIRRLTHLAVLALREWGVENCKPKLIKFRENAVFEVRSPKDTRAALRVHRQDYHDAEALRSELEWMLMLRNKGVIAPKPIAATSGETIVTLSTDELPGAWKVDMLSWLNGEALGAVGEPLGQDSNALSAIYDALGRELAKMHRLTSEWAPEKPIVRHAWDTDGLVGDTPLWGRFWELDALTPGHKSLFLNAREAIATDLEAYGKRSDNFGLIHADLVPENVLLADWDTRDGNDSPAGTGKNPTIQVIDFDDAGFGWHMFDLVTAFHWLREEPAFDSIRDSLLSGYNAIKPLTSADIATIPLFSAARSLTYVGWIHTRSDSPEAGELLPIVLEIAEQCCSDYLAKR